MNRYIALGLAVLAITAQFTSGLVCKECENALSEEHCDRIGKMRLCPPGEDDQCQIQIRYHGGWGPGYRIFKNCKQGTACDNNFVQNPRDAWQPTQCIPTFINSVCRCCCNTDGCNVAQSTCFQRSQVRRCPMPPSRIYMGSVSCTNGAEVGSRCTTTCVNGGALRAGFAAYSVCRYDGAWSHPFAQCTRHTCEHMSLLNGWFGYSAGVGVGSNASPYCNYGYDLIGAKVLRCIRTTTGTRWSLPKPSCRRRQCPDRGEVAGGTTTCENGRYTQSHCNVECGRGRYLVGITNFYCQDNGVWSHKLPTCELAMCPPRGSLVNGAVECSDANNIDSICNSTCDEGYELDGVRDSICVIDGNGADWSDPLPVCKITQCQPRGALVDGVVRCTDDNNVGSVCTARCLPGFELEGEPISNCLEDANWDIDLPECRPSPCRGQGRLRHGEISCTSDNFGIGTECSFVCTGENYALVPPDATSNICLPDRSWSRPKPCCARPCPPYALMDLVIVLDSSSSIGAPNWILLTDFVALFIQAFEVSRSAANIGIFRYNGEVDPATEILLNDFPNDRAALLAKFRDIPYDGSGTKTGQALQYALDSHLTPAAGNRPDVLDVVLLITDGKSSDPVAAPAKAIRDTGAIVFVLGVEPTRGRLDEAELLEIAGVEEQVIVPKGGFAALSSDFSLVLGKSICGGECGRN